MSLMENIESTVKMVDTFHKNYTSSDAAKVGKIVTIINLNIKQIKSMFANSGPPAMSVGEKRHLAMLAGKLERYKSLLHQQKEVAAPFGSSVDPQKEVAAPSGSSLDPRRGKVEWRDLTTAFESRRTNPNVVSHADQRFYPNTMNRRPEGIYPNLHHPYYFNRNWYGYPHDYPNHIQHFYFNTQMPVRPNLSSNGTFGDSGYAPYLNTYTSFSEHNRNGSGNITLRTPGADTNWGQKQGPVHNKKAQVPMEVTLENQPSQTQVVNVSEKLSDTSDVTIGASTPVVTHQQEINIDQSKNSLQSNQERKYNTIDITAIKTNESYLRRLAEIEKDKSVSANINSDINIPQRACEEVKTSEEGIKDDGIQKVLDRVEQVLPPGNGSALNSSNKKQNQQGCEISFLNEKLRLRSEKAQRQCELADLMCQCENPANHCSKETIGDSLHTPNLEETDCITKQMAEHLPLLQYSDCIRKRVVPESGKKYLDGETVKETKATKEKSCQDENGRNLVKSAVPIIEEIAKLPRISLRRKSVAQIDTRPLEHEIDNQITQQEDNQMSYRRRGNDKRLDDTNQNVSKRETVDGLQMELGIELAAKGAPLLEEKKIAPPGENKSGPKKLHKRRKTIAEWEIHRRFDNDHYPSLRNETNGTDAGHLQSEFCRVADGQPSMSGGAFKDSEATAKKVPPLKINKRVNTPTKTNSENLNSTSSIQHRPKECETGGQRAHQSMSGHKDSVPSTSEEIPAKNLRRKSTTACVTCETVDLTKKGSLRGRRKSTAVTNELPRRVLPGRRKSVNVNNDEVVVQPQKLGKSTLRNEEVKHRNSFDSEVSDKTSASGSIGKGSVDQSSRKFQLKTRPSNISNDQNVMIPLKDYVPPIQRSPTMKLRRRNTKFAQLFGSDSEDDDDSKCCPPSTVCSQNEEMPGGIVPWKLRKVDDFFLNIKHGHKSKSDDVFEKTAGLRLRNIEKSKATAECKQIEVELNTALVISVNICADSVITKQSSSYDIEMENVKELNNLMQMHFADNEITVQSNCEQIVCTPDIQKQQSTTVPPDTSTVHSKEPESTVTKKRTRARNIKITPLRKNLNTNTIPPSVSAPSSVHPQALSFDFNKYVADRFCHELWYPVYYNLKNCEMIIKQMCFYRRLGMDLISAQEILRPFHNTWERSIDQLNVRIVEFFRHRTIFEFCYKTFLKHCYYYGVQRGTRVTLPSMIKFMCLVVKRMKETTENVDWFMGLFCSSALLEYQETVLKNAPLAHMWNNPVMLLAFQNLNPDESESTEREKTSMLTPAQEQAFTKQVQDYCYLIQNYYKLSYTMPQGQTRHQAAKRRPHPHFSERSPPPYPLQPPFRNPLAPRHNTEYCSSITNQNLTPSSYVDERSNRSEHTHPPHINKDFRIRLPLRVPQTEPIVSTVTPPLSSSDSSTQAPTPTPTISEAPALVPCEVPVATIDKTLTSDQSNAMKIQESPSTEDGSVTDQEELDSKEHVRQMLTLPTTTEYEDDDIIDVDAWFIKKMRECDYIDLIDFDMSYSQIDRKNPPSDSIKNVGTTSLME